MVQSISHIPHAQQDQLLQSVQWSPEWSDASKTCASDGSHLLIINSPAEATEVKRYLDSTVETYIIGFHDMFEERHFETVPQCTYTTQRLL